MAINPFPRVPGLELPSMAGVGVVRPDPSVWSNLASIGDVIGEQRERARMGEILRSATDASGNLDFKKAATAIALTGRDPTKYLNALVQQQTLSRSQESLAETIRANQERERLAREEATRRQQEADRPQYQVEHPSLMRPGGFYELPRKPGEQPKFTPFPTPAPVVAPQSALPETGPAMAAAAVNPEEAPPYQVAGPPMPPPTGVPAAAAAPAEKPARNEAYLRTLPPSAQIAVKAVAEYERDPNTFDAKDKADVVTAAKIYRPDYNTSGYEKRGTMTEAQGKAQTFANRMENAERDIGEHSGSAQGLSGVVGKVGTYLPLGQNLQTPEFQLYNRAKLDWITAQLRKESGAAIARDEYSKSDSTFFPQPGDDPRTIAAKAEARRVESETMKHEAGPSYKSFVKPREEQRAAEVPKVKNDAEANALIGKARDALKRDPSQRDEIAKRLRDRGVANPELYLGQ